MNDYVWSTFRVVCVARRLLKNDDEWINCFTKIVRFFTERSLRCLFVTVLIHDEIVDSRALWDRFCSNICDDLSHRIRQFLSASSDFVDSHLNYDLYLIVKDLQEHNKTLVDFEFSSSSLAWFDINISLLIAIELNYNISEQIIIRDQKTAQLNTEQLQIFDNILIVIVNCAETTQFFVHDVAETDKIFLYECLCHHFRAQKFIVLCVASTDIAAQLLFDEEISHSRFKIFIVCSNTSICHVSAQFELTQLIRRAALIIWD